MLLRFEKKSSKIINHTYDDIVKETKICFNQCLHFVAEKNKVPNLGIVTQSVSLFQNLLTENIINRFCSRNFYLNK